MENVVIKRQYAAYNVDAYNRTVVASADLPNGSVFELVERSTEEKGEGEVWVAKNTTAKSKNIWMATSPEVVITKSGNNMYTGLTPDPREFVNLEGRMIDAIKLCEGDIIEMTGEGISGIETPSNKYLIPQESSMTLKASTTATGCLALHKIGTGRLHIGTGALNAKAIPTYIFEVVNAPAGA